MWSLLASPRLGGMVATRGRQSANCSWITMSVGIFCPGGGIWLTTAFDGRPESAAFGNFASEPVHLKDLNNGSTLAQYIPRRSGMTNIVAGGLDGAWVAILFVEALGDW